MLGHCPCQHVMCCRAASWLKLQANRMCLLMDPESSEEVKQAEEVYHLLKNRFGAQLFD